ncbi:hypothetical protein OKA05_20990 [Luteolibacter arcticus]|uniref:Verru_Chthon cassette protein A n=1 Tax=Luteolibacter arcticus TaxID=1581411 RepID=A0ABT3GNG0_9BACT|nr:hypothetical protein [Luteolibacter arcticus]MCW1925050.1 hypothetical protein [Luteolibacter arcticus]
MTLGNRSSSRFRFHGLRFATARHRGFALVVVMSLMMLIMVLAIGLLQLGTVSLRTSNHDMALAQARSNARVSLMLAINQLQMELGSDRRISAPAGILDSSPDSPEAEGVSQPHFTGVWNAAESPFAKWTLDRPSYDKEQSFRSWLVSGDPSDLRTMDFAKTGAPSGDESRTAVGGGADSSRDVAVPVISSERAGFAWWTSDNGTKAVLRAGEEPDSSSKYESLVGSRRANGDGHAALDPRLPDRDNGLDGRLVDLATADVAVPPADPEDVVSEKLIHDLTTRSEIVPVDVTNGGLRKCMNVYLDWLAAQSPANRAAAGTLGKMRNASMDYRVCSWDQLRNYESLGRAGSMVTLDAVTKRPKIRTFKQTGAAPEKEWNPTMSDDRFRIQPVLLKLSYVVSYATEKLTAPTDPNKPYAMRLFLYPMAVLWNPYNVDLEVPEYCASGICPLTFDINKGAPNAFKLDLTKTNTATRLAFGPEMGGAEKFTNLVIPAGATKVLYPQPVRWESHPDEHRYKPKAPYEYYMWAQTKKFDLGDSNFGGVLKNLLGKADSFASIPGQELTGAPSDVLRVAVSPVGNDGLISLGVDGAHTDWWGNNGPGGDTQDTLQKFGTSTTVNFRMESSTPQISLIPETEVPSRTFSQLENRPTPLLLFEFYRKAADEDLFPNKPGSFTVAGNPAQGSTSSSIGSSDPVTPWFESAYSFRFKSLGSWLDVTKTFQLPPDRDDRVYFGASYSPRGQLNVVDQEIPLSPMVSLAELQHLPMFDYRPTYDPAVKTFNTVWYKGDYAFYLGRMTQFAQNHAIGNSYASPGIPSDKLTQAGWRTAFSYGEFNHLRVDRSYVANAVLWDSWFCSSVAAQDGLVLTQDGDKRKSREVAKDFLEGTTSLPNDAVQPRFQGDLDELVSSLFDGSGNPLRDAHEKIAEYLRIEGGFNVNSVSEEAWAHFLSNLLSRPVLMMESRTGTESVSVLAPEKDKFLISRHSLANAPPAERGSGKEQEDRYWNGAREVTAGQIRELATAIVKQVKTRGPFLSLGEFVNRRLVREADLALCGPLQAALDDPDVTINEPLRDTEITGSESTSKGKPRYSFAAAAEGPRKQGIAGYVTQADLLSSLGTSITPRSDTFTIRAMGEAKDDKGNVLIRVWCEAVVQRGSAYVDPADAASVAPAALKPLNARFGRRFDVVSFRWLNPQEVKAVS